MHIAFIYVCAIRAAAHLWCILCCELFLDIEINKKVKENCNTSVTIYIYIYIYIHTQIQVFYSI